MKKDYFSPKVRIVEIEESSCILSLSDGEADTEEIITDPNEELDPDDPGFIII